MASEVFTAKEGSVNPINASGRSMTPTRQRNAIMNARVEPSRGKTRIDLGGGQSATIEVSYVNMSQGSVRGKLNMRDYEGANSFKFGGSSGRSFEDAVNEVKRDLRRNI